MRRFPAIFSLLLIITLISGSEISVEEGVLVRSEFRMDTISSGSVISEDYLSEQLLLKKYLFENKSTNFQSRFIRSAEGLSDFVFITIDDGYDLKIAEQAVTTLCGLAAKVTLFPTGSMIKARPEIWRRAIDCGIEIGNHSYSHPNFYKISTEDYISDIKRWDDTAWDLLAYRARWFRPPFGTGFETNTAAVKNLHLFDALKHDVVHWGPVDTYGEIYSKPGGDQKTSEDVAKFVIQNVRPGSIVLLHFVRRDVDALPAIILGIKERGLTLATLSEGIPHY